MSDLDAAFAAIDAANAADPNLTGRGPRALFQGVRATHWLALLSSSCPETVSLAARAHHLARWTVLRADFPEGRAGYHRWKRAAREAGQRAIGDVLTPLGWTAAVVQRVGSLINREGLGTDPDTQLVEDAACLVFLETQYDELIERLGEDAVSEAVRKTLRKMSVAAIALAPQAVPGERGLALLSRVAGER